MHHFIAMFYALVFAVTPAAKPAPQQTAEIPLAMQSANSLTAAPRHSTVYSGSACTSCRMMTVSYHTR